MMRWSPISSVFCIEPEGITRAWPSVPLISRNAMATHIQAMISRTTLRRSGRFSPFFFSEFTIHRHRSGCGLFFLPGRAGRGPPIDLFVIHFELHQLGRVVARIAGSAELAFGVAQGLLQAGEGEIAERVRADKLAGFLRRVRRRDQLFARGRVHAVIARRNRRRATDAHVHFARARFAHHAHDLAAGGAADNGVVHQHDAPAREQFPHGIQLQLDAEIADGLRRLDESAADVVVADQPHAERNSRAEGKSDRRRHAGVRHRHDDVRGGGMLFRQQLPERLAAVVHRAAKNRAVGPREIDVLENAVLMRLFRREMDGLDPRARNAHHLAGLDLADIFRAEQIEGAGFRSHHPHRTQPPDIERAEAARIADGVKLVEREEQERVRAFHLVERVADGPGEIPRCAAGNQMDDDFRVAGGLEDRAAMLELAPPVAGIGEIAVVAERELAFVAVNQDGLAIVQRSVSGGGIPRMTYRGIARKLGNHVGLEDFFDFAHGAVRVQVHAVARDDARRFLAAMLQRVQAKVSELGCLGMAEDAEHTAFVVEVVVEHPVWINHFDRSVRSSELAQASRKSETPLRITACAFHSMRNSPPRVTCPISCAATRYCLAIASTRAIEPCATDTTARAPRSPNSAASAGSRAARVTRAERPSLAKQHSARVVARPPSLTSCAERIAPSAASAARHSMSRFSAVISMAGGAPATMPAITLAYADEESSLASSISLTALASFLPSSNTIASPSVQNPMPSVREASSSTPSIPSTGVG